MPGEPLYLPADQDAWKRATPAIPPPGVDLTITQNWPCQDERETDERWMLRQRMYRPFSLNTNDIVPNWPQIAMGVSPATWTAMTQGEPASTAPTETRPGSSPPPSPPPAGQFGQQTRENIPMSQEHRGEAQPEQQRRQGEPRGPEEPGPQPGSGGPPSGEQSREQIEREHEEQERTHEQQEREHEEVERGEHNRGHNRGGNKK